MKLSVRYVGSGKYCYLYLKEYYETYLFNQEERKAIADHLREIAEELSPQDHNPE
jgi:hypothetical protein